MAVRREFQEYWAEAAKFGAGSACRGAARRGLDHAGRGAEAAREAAAAAAAAEVRTLERARDVCRRAREREAELAELERRAEEARREWERAEAARGLAARYRRAGEGYRPDFARPATDPAPREANMLGPSMAQSVAASARRGAMERWGTSCLMGGGPTLKVATERQKWEERRSAYEAKRREFAQDAGFHEALAAAEALYRRLAAAE